MSPTHSLTHTQVKEKPFNKGQYTVHQLITTEFTQKIVQIET